MAFTQPTMAVNNIQTLQDITLNQANAVKILHDKAGSDLKAYLIAFLQEIASITDGTSGADNIGATAITDLTGATVQAILESIRNKLKSITAGSSGADFVNMTAITETGSNTTVQSVIEALITRLKATEDNASGADLIGATAISGLSGTTVQALLEALKLYFDSAGPIANDSIEDEKLKQTGNHILPNFNAHVADYAAHGTFARQLLINGNFDIWQRGTQYVNLPTATYLADRWLNIVTEDTGSLPSITTTRESIINGELQNSINYYRITTNGAGSGFGANARHMILQRNLNAVSLLSGSGRYLTLSFYARSSIAGKRIGVNIHQYYGSGGSPSPLENIYGRSFDLTSSWTKFTYTWETNTLDGKTFGTNNDDLIELQLYYMWGDNYKIRFGSSTAESYGGAGTIDIAQVQFNYGSSALPFSPKSFAEELMMCQKVLRKSYSYNVKPATNVPEGSAHILCSDNTNNKFVIMSEKFAVEKRIPPTITLYDTSGNANKITTRDASDGGTPNVTPSIGATNIGTRGFKVKHQGTVAGMAFHWTADSEI